MAVVALTTDSGIFIFWVSRRVDRMALDDLDILLSLKHCI